MAKEVKPENLAAATARLFLGVSSSAPSATTTRSPSGRASSSGRLAAFFAGMQNAAAMRLLRLVRELTDRREMAIPGTDKVVQASFLDGTEPRWKYKVGPRVTLADWMTAPDNPYFARAAVNRLWAHFFGTGLVDPVDDLGDDKPRRATPSCSTSWPGSSPPTTST